jgi:NADPH:quinone reductase-like Zn-dependent oxidoreductase
VVTFAWNEGWAEQRVVNVGDLAVLPDSVEIGTAAALPVAGVTALRALRACGDLRGQRVLITGASGGVGRFAVQLADQMGAFVIGLVSSAARGEGLTALGADQVITSLDELSEPVAAVLENVGGETFNAAMDRLREDGVMVRIGRASGTYGEVQPTGNQRVIPFNMGSGLAADLAYLVDLLAAGKLDVQIGWRGSWERIDEAAQALLNRQFVGKAVLDV